MTAVVETRSERRYHDTSSAYVLPNDAVEQDRLDAQAAAITEMIGGVPFLAPFSSMIHISKAVDVGCGTGIATVQLANRFPSANVYGLDISPVPEAVQKLAPANANWVKGDVLDEEGESEIKPASRIRMQPGVHTPRQVFAPGSLDYIFGRMLFLGINDWPRYFSTAAGALKSGGLIEHQDLDWKFYRVGTSECLSDTWEWYDAVVVGAEKSGLSTRAGSGAAPLMKAAGLEIVSVRNFEFSFVPSAKTPRSQAMGRYVQAKLLPQYPELLRKMLSAQGITGDQLQKLTTQCLQDITSEEGIHQKYTVTIARKL